ncbi:amidohydrolase family protein [Aminicella lysinilytica]|uniref:amidohydrolase family protein n=1 Tax=Aminicella lysinilytica TaxID=433323 RepID=UPI0026EA2691|nr:amidohydrolase family protein [Aminicella lysinilytica]
MSACNVILSGSEFCACQKDDRDGHTWIAQKAAMMGIPVATASDFNPGSCPSLNLQFVMNLACIKYRLLPEEVLTAVTINPACALNRGDKVGTLEVGKQGDLVIWDAPDMEMLCYRFCSNLAAKVIKKGKIVK